MCSCAWLMAILLTRISKIKGYQLWASCSHMCINTKQHIMWPNGTDALQLVRLLQAWWRERQADTVNCKPEANSILQTGINSSPMLVHNMKSAPNTWQMKSEHKAKLDRNKMSMQRWTCNFILKERKKNTETNASEDVHVCAWWKRSDAYTVTSGAEFIERLDVEPRSLVASQVQSNSHSILLQQRWKPLVHRQILVTLEMQQLYNAAVLDARAQQLLVFHLVLLLLQFRSMLHATQPYTHSCWAYSYCLSIPLNTLSVLSGIDKQ